MLDTGITVPDKIVAKKNEVGKRNFRPQNKAILELYTSDTDFQNETEGNYMCLHTIIIFLFL